MAHPQIKIVTLRRIPHIDMFAAGVPRWVDAGETLEVAGKQHWLDELRAADPTVAPADEATAKWAGLTKPASAQAAKKGS